MLTCLSLGRGGRMANQMFQIAGVIGLAKKYGHDYAFPYWSNIEHKEVFGSQEDIDIQSWFKNKLPLLQPDLNYQDIFIEFNTKDENISIPGYGNYNIAQQFSGHLQSEKYFAHCKDLIRHYFEFDKARLYLALTNIDTKWLLEKTCAVHVRVGDYAKTDSMQPVLTTEYYLSAMFAAPKDTLFVIFSDQPEVAKQIIPLEFNCHFVEGNHYMVDFFLMTRCNNFIIGNSTFSWWAAWLANNPHKKIIAPATWWTDKARKEWGYTTKDLFPEGWQVI